MAEVFIGSTIGAEGFSRKVAIKRVLPGYSDNPQFSQMFVAEARISSRLGHPNIVSVMDFDRDAENRLFLVMELVEGRDLDALLQTGALPFSAVIHITAEILRGLGYAHELPEGSDGFRGVIHRDVSPHNVLLSWAGACKVSDFGIAKAREASEATASVFIKGKPAYMSPEQANGQPLDGRSDIFAVGIMLWEMLVARRLFVGGDTRATLAQVLFAQIPRPRSVRADVPKDLDRVCMKMLERDVNQRYRNAAEAIADLMKCAAAPRAGSDELVQLLAERFAEAPGRNARRPADAFGQTPAVGMPAGPATPSGGYPAIGGGAISQSMPVAGAHPGTGQASWGGVAGAVPGSAPGYGGMPGPGTGHQLRGGANDVTRTQLPLSPPRTRSRMPLIAGAVLALAAAIATIVVLATNSSKSKTAEPATVAALPAAGSAQPSNQATTPGQGNALPTTPGATIPSQPGASAEPTPAPQTAGPGTEPAAGGVAPATAASASGGVAQAPPPAPLPATGVAAPAPSVMPTKPADAKVETKAEPKAEKDRKDRDKRSSSSARVKGQLEVITDPPCTVYANGRRLGESFLRTELPVGRVSITLVNTDRGIKVSVPVLIEEGKTAKIDKSF